jgi:hypothetical protein
VAAFADHCRAVLTEDALPGLTDPDFGRHG